jgi:cob(I)alamin adenosyltransferase
MPRRKRGITELSGSGDDGTTALLGGGRARKDDPRLEAYGTVDEASSAIGVGKSLATDERVKAICEEAQRGLYKVGTELATNPNQPGKFGEMGDAEVAHLDDLCRELETEVAMPAGFVLPGTTPASAALDLARTVIRRAERRTLALAPEYGGARRWLNRLSLLIFILARYEESRSGTSATPARDAPG